MINLSADQITPESWPNLTHTDGLTDAWRQVHFAAQVAAEFGKGWAEAKDDDSHSAFQWFNDADGLEGAAAGDPESRCRLKFEGLEVSLRRADGRTARDIGLRGRTLEQGMEWIREAATEQAGPPRQEAKPAPDLPDHAVASGAEFGPDVGALNDLADIYDATDRMLRTLAEVLPDTEESPKIWPHHFDIATLITIAKDSGDVTKTIGVGLTPPDSVDDNGYWYVSPWSKGDAGQNASWPALPHGHWHDRGDLKMAVFPVSELIAIEGSEAEGRALAEFVASAFTACLAALKG